MKHGRTTTTTTTTATEVGLAAAADDDGDDDNNKETFKFYCTFPAASQESVAGVGKRRGGGRTSISAAAFSLRAHLRQP